MVETWRGVELRWAEEEAVRRKCVDEARAEPGRAEAETRRRHEAAAEARRRETEADAEAYSHLLAQASSFEFGLTRSSRKRSLRVEGRECIVVAEYLGRWRVCMEGEEATGREPQSFPLGCLETKDGHGEWRPATAQPRPAGLVQVRAGEWEIGVLGLVGFWRPPSL